MKQRFLRMLSMLLVVCQISGLTAMTAFARPDWPNDTGILAEAGIAIDADTGAVLYGQNIHNPYPPASITKLLTALVVLEHCKLDEVVEYSDHALLSVEQGSGNKLSLRAGDKLTVEESLYALLLISVNQCANGLAEHTAGSMSAFVDMMNQKVAELGLEESHFDNPSGLNGDTQYVTAYDMAMIARAAFANEDLLRISSSLNSKIGTTQLFPDGQSFRNEHRLLYTTDPASEFYCPEAVAGKTGYLIAAGNTLVTYGEKDGRRVISVILKGTPKQYFVDGKELLQFGLNRFKNISIPENETRYGKDGEPITLNGVSYAPDKIWIEEGTMITIPKNAEFADVDVAVEENLSDQVPSGAVGRLDYYYNDRRVGSAYLMTEAVQVDVGTEPGKTPAETQEKETQGKETEAWNPMSGVEMPKLQLPKINPLIVLAVFFGIAAVVLAVFGVRWLILNKKKEAEELEARRARRRERLMQEGGTDRQEEFDRILKERWNRK